MRTVQMTMEEDLVVRIDRAARKLKTTRSAFTRRVLRKALADLAKEEMIARYRLGYGKQPVKPGEFDVWESEQAWGDE